MADTEAAKKERARQKFLADRAALLQKAQKRLESPDEPEEDDEKWTTDKGIFRF
jgi:hypothetical protein